MIAYLIASKNFKDEEYFIPRELLEESGYQVVTFSDKEGTSLGSEGGEVDSLSLDHISVKDYTALIIAGGPGALKFLDNEDVYSIIREFDGAGKLVAAICISPVILAKSGIIRDKEATVWSSGMDKSPIKILQENGAKYINKDVVEDELIITGNGPDAAPEFARKIIEKLSLKSNNER